MATNSKPMAPKQNMTPWAAGNDAAYIRPKLIPDYELMPRDDSGGPDYDPYTAQWGDGGFVQGSKAHLSASGGSDDPVEGDEQSDAPRTRAANAATPGGVRQAATPAPSKSARLAKE